MFSYLIVIGSVLFTSCVTYKDFSKTHKMAKPIDYMGLEVQKLFEIDKVYRIQLDDNRLIDLRVKEVREDRLMGVQKKKGTELQGMLEIPFDRILLVEKKTINPIGTVILAIGSFYLVTILIELIRGDSIQV
ncbi:hypothetical protein [Shivajiella indica]